MLTFYDFIQVLYLPQITTLRSESILSQRCVPMQVTRTITSADHYSMLLTDRIFFQFMHLTLSTTDLRMPCIHPLHFMHATNTGISFVLATHSFFSFYTYCLST